MSPLGFKPSVSSALFALCRGEYNVHSLRSNSSAKPADEMGTLSNIEQGTDVSA